MTMTTDRWVNSIQRAMNRERILNRLVCILAVLILGLLLAACGTEEGEKSDLRVVDEAVVARAQAAALPLKQALLAELSTALQEGPVHAIQVCQVRAPGIADSLSGNDIQVGRTSHKVRNPNNAPEPWMEPLLTAYLEADSISAPQAIYIDEATVGYVEPLYAKPMCLTCHGENLDPKVQAILADQYPGDRSTGFKAGDFRGMIWVTLPAHDAGAPGP